MTHAELVIATRIAATDAFYRYMIASESQHDAARARSEEAFAAARAALTDALAS